MSIVIALLENVGSSAAYAVLVVGSASAAWLIRSRRHRDIWAESIRFRANSLIVLSSVIHSGDPSRTPRCSASEVRSLEAIMRLFSRFRSRFQFRVSTDVSDDELQRFNLVLLGSPLKNDVARRALNALRLSQLRYRTDEHTFSIGGRDFRPVYNNDGGIEEDYAVIVKAPNPFRHYQADSKALMMFMGCHGIGTFGAVRAAIDRSPLLKIARQVKQKAFIAVVHVYVDEFLVTSTEVIHVTDLHPNPLLSERLSERDGHKRSDKSEAGLPEQTSSS